MLSLTWPLEEVRTEPLQITYHCTGTRAKEEEGGGGYKVGEEGGVEDIRLGRREEGGGRREEEDIRLGRREEGGGGYKVGEEGGGKREEEWRENAAHCLGWCTPHWFS